MNCQEYRALIEDALDVSLHGDPERRVRLHLEHCASCRDYFKLRRDEHVALFSGINAACEELRLPEGFADRLAESVRNRRGTRRGWRRFSLPRWAIVAASVVAMAGLVLANAKLIMENAESEVGEREEAKETEGAEAAGLEVADAEASDSSTQLETNQKGEVPMGKVKAAAAALTVAYAAGAVPLAAGVGSALGVATSASFESVDPPYGAASSVATSCIDLDARAIVCRMTNVIPIYTCPRTGVTIIVF